MIQGLLLRDYKDRKTETGFDLGIRAESVEQIFSSPLELLEGKLTPSERFNVYYTVAECLEEKGRKLAIQHHIPFDVDGIAVPPVGAETSLEPLARLVCKAIGVPFEECGVLYSGNGLQFLVGTLEPITSVEYFDAHRAHYGAICDRIDSALETAKIQGKADRSVWSPARLMRYPCTLNVKKNREPRTGVILNAKIVRSEFSVVRNSNLPDVSVHDQISDRILVNFPTPDTKTILEECKFLQWNFSSAAEVDEPNWYAALSVVSRLPDGRKLSHQMSKGHPGYSFNNVERKIDQALQSSGPRTCKNINALSKKCQTCKHFGTKLVSPIMIEGPEHTRTVSTGFYHTHVGADGIPKRGKPDVQGLRNHFSREFTYKVTENNGFVYVFNGTHYEEMSRDRILKYAEDHFDPAPLSALRNEFYQAVKLYNLVPSDWFAKSSRGFMNFKNGVLNVKTKELTPHSAEMGFRSVLPCDYNPDAVSPLFEKFIDQVTVGRTELGFIIQEYMGYTFVNEGCYLEKCLLFQGEGANGKSTLVNIIRKLAGKDAVSNLSFGALSNEQNRVMLDGKIANISEENSKASFRNTELIKNLVSGGVVQAKRVYSPPFEFHNEAKLIMLCNELPQLSDHTNGFYRKFLIIPFDAIFDEDSKDVHIAKKLEAELPGIFNWIMRGYERLKEQGNFTKAEAVDQIAQDYRIEEDSSYAWVFEHCEFSRDAKTPRTEIYTDYSTWCDNNGVKVKQEAQHIYAMLRKHIISKLKINKKEIDTKSNGIRYFTGLKLRKEATF